MTTADDTLIISHRRRSLIEIFCYTLATAWFVLQIIYYGNKHNLTIHVAFALLALLVLCSAIYSRLVTKTFLIIDDEGIHDYRSYVGVGTIKWKNIVKLESEKTIFPNSKFLKVYVDNAEEIIHRQKGWKHYRLRQRMRKYKTPVLLSAYDSNYTFDELATLIIERLKQSQTVLQN